MTWQAQCHDRLFDPRPNIDFAYQSDCINPAVQLYAGPLIREIAKVALAAAVHKQGTYALQKVLESPCSAHEYVLVGRELMKSAKDLLTTEPGIYVMAKLVEQLVINHAPSSNTSVLRIHRLWCRKAARPCAWNRLFMCQVGTPNVIVLSITSELICLADIT